MRLSRNGEGRIAKDARVSSISGLTEVPLGIAGSLVLHWGVSRPRHWHSDVVAKLSTLTAKFLVTPIVPFTLQKITSCPCHPLRIRLLIYWIF